MKTPNPALPWLLAKTVSEAPGARHEPVKTLNARESSLTLPAPEPTPPEYCGTPVFLTTAHVARYLGLPEALIRSWRSKGRGPRFYKFPGKKGAVLYQWSDVWNYVNACAVSTSPMIAPRSGRPPGKPRKHAP